MRELIDDAVVLSRKAVAEAVDVLTCLTSQNGVVAGALRSKHASHQQKVQHKAQAAPGNHIRLRHQARRPQHELGTCEIELIEPLAARALMHGRIAIAGLQTVCDALAAYVPDAVPLEDSFFPDTLNTLRAHAHAIDAPLQRQIAFDRMLPDALGYAVEPHCFTPGCDDPTAFFSPRTGRPACAQHGAPWQHVLWPLPRLWRLSPDEKVANDVCETDVSSVVRLLNVRYRSVPRYRRLSDPAASRIAYYAAVVSTVKEPV